MRIGFYQPHLCLFGTTVSMFDYANFNQTLLGNESIIFYDKDDTRNNEDIIIKFEEAEIPTISLSGHENMEELSANLDFHEVDALYIQKTGKPGGRWVDNTPCFIHCVGCENDPHGHVYAYVSDWLSQQMTGGQSPVVPYMAHLPDHQDNFREELGIPKEAVVFGRLGGFYSWNIPFVNNVIKDVLKERDDVYFLFAQTTIPFSDKRVIHVEPFADLYTKRKFINTSDAFLHARNEGESFGMAVAEFSISNKPTITYENSPEKNHIYQLGDKGIYYKNSEDLKDILLNFEVDNSKNWNAYSDFAPEKIIQKFKEVFINSL